MTPSEGLSLLSSASKAEIHTGKLVMGLDFSRTFSIDSLEDLAYFQEQMAKTSFANISQCYLTTTIVDNSTQSHGSIMIQIENLSCLMLLLNTSMAALIMSLNRLMVTVKRNSETQMDIEVYIQK